MPTPLADLAPLIREASSRALVAGALQPIETEEEWIDDRPVPFIVRWASSFTHRNAKHVTSSGAAGPAGNPFLPFDPVMFVADLSSTHVLLLNKFPVYEGHVLIVTRQFAEQESMLEVADFYALARTLVSVPGVGFLNGGPLAGASQPHRHMQMIPIDRLPADVLFAETMPTGRVTELSALPFVHACARFDTGMFDDAATAAACLHELFREACAVAAIREEGGRLPPYNLIVTRRWLLVVPRRFDAWQGGGGRLPLNAMSFAGVILARERSQQAALRAAGLMKLLAAITYPRI